MVRSCVEWCGGGVRWALRVTYPSSHEGEFACAERTRLRPLVCAAVAHSAAHTPNPIRGWKEKNKTIKGTKGEERTEKMRNRRNKRTNRKKTEKIGRAHV